MRIPFRFPIGVKLSVLSIALLLMAMVPTALKTSSIFKSVSGKREEDSNRAQAESRASEVSVTLEKMVEKITFFAPLLLKEAVTAKSTAAAAAAVADQRGSALRQTFAADPDIVSLEIYKKGAKSPEKIESLANDSYLKSFKLDKSYLRIVDKERKFPVREVFGGDVVIRNRSLPKGAPLLTLGIPVVKDELGRVSHVAIANVRLNSIQKAFADNGERLVYLVDRKGTVFAHPDEALALKGTSLAANEIVKKAMESKVAKGQLRYFKPDAREHFISAFSKARFDLAVISEAPESIVLEPAAYVQRQVLFITCVVLSLALIVVAAMSLTITRPVQRLVGITKEIARGNFELQVARLVTSNDEVGSLAVSFDAMLAGLRERDKVKNLFSKFHGSSVAESLMASDKVETGGVRKKVVILFSDIRGFTATSESTSAEQVVSMLNEYFSIMVKIILDNHGIVDKFIGDAIMAIWGAPQGTDRDSFYAVKACLEMRKAIADLNAVRISRGEAPLMIGIGVHTGDAISGQIGSAERMEFTVIGDNVNMASRIEASTKAFGSDLLISQAVADEIGGSFILELAGRTKVKGKSEPLSLYKVRGYVRENGIEEIVKTEYSDYLAEKADKVEVV